MAAPIVSWYDAENTAQQTTWDTGVVDAGSVGPDTQFLIWNNRGGGTSVSDMESCVITTKDTQGGNTGDVVVERWVEVRVDELGEMSFTAIGGTVSHPFGNGITPQVISGAANDGTLANADANYCLLTLHWAPLATATAGTRNWLTRAAYQYV